MRFIHGAPGVGETTVTVDGHAAGSIGFAQATQWHGIRTGRFHWALASGHTTLAAGTATVGGGAYDIVVLQRAHAVSLGIYRARGGRAGAGLVRVIHGAPELGSPALTIDGRPIARRLAYSGATPYLSLAPGTHRLAVRRPQTSTAPAIAAAVSVRPGVAYSAIVLGTRGRRLRVVEVVDRGAPGARRPSAGAAHLPARHSAMRSVTVRAGDSLWRIAQRLAGPGASEAAVEGRVAAIWKRNAARIGTGDPNLIFAGTHLRLE